MKRMTMATICSGAVQEKVDRALRAVADNILDPNTDARKKRSITLKITFVPNEDDREDITVLVDVAKSLAPDAGVKTQLFVAKDLETGAITVQEHQRGEIKGQLSFDDLDEDAEEDEESSSTSSDTGEEPLTLGAAIGRVWGSGARGSERRMG